MTDALKYQRWALSFIAWWLFALAISIVVGLIIMEVLG